tara:strand:+ start:6745 stop:9132 length:2388 start_codon:yes stop_codon:yes gene_type:complete
LNTPDNFLDQDVSIDLVKEIRYYIFFWPWFLISVLLFSFASFIYLRYADTIYQTSATLQVKDATSDPSAFLTQSSSPMFNLGRTKIDNYIAQIGSKINLSELSDRLDLQTKIYSVGRVKQSILFGNEIPFEIIFKTEKTFSAKDKNIISLFLEPNEGIIQIGDDMMTFVPTALYETEDFKLIINYDLIDKRFEKDQIEQIEFRVIRTSKENTIIDLSRQIGLTSTSKLGAGDNIDLMIQGPNRKRNELIINTLIEVANEKQISDKQETFSLSIDFINQRLISVKSEIDSLTLKTTGFKSDNLIFSPEAQTELALNNLSSLDQERFDLSTQKELAISLQSNLKNQEDFSLLPSNIGLASGNVNELVLSYNELALKRKNLLAGATTRNPVVVQLSEDLTDLRMNILKSIDNYILNINTSLSEFKDFQNQTNSEVSKIPNLEATLLTFQRKFQLAEKLYLFLLQRREEASISYESTVPNTRIIDYASTDFIPVAPKKSIIFLGSLILGLFIPFVVLYILKLMDSKIHTREQLEKLAPNLDIVGEVPFIEDIQSTMDYRGIFAESSRVIRSNISYKLNNKQDSQVILSTSSIKGEGKTLTAFNIAATYVAARKKVLLIGADLRNPQVHKLVDIDRKSNSKGLSTIISEGITELNSEYFHTIDIFKHHMDILLSGPIPPNPAELLGSESFLNIIEELKKSYDYIIIDTAPLVLVSDTFPLLQIADLVLYTVRAQYTDSKLISFINSLVDDKKVNKIGVVLNGIKAGAKSYYKYGYSYRYIYQYKYNYGYGYGYGNHEDKS